MARISVAFGPDNKTSVVGLDDGTIVVMRVWSIE